MIAWRFLCAAVFASVALALPSLGQVSWSEFGDGGADSGELPSSGYDLSSISLSDIVGELSFSGDVDIYRITIVDPAAFSATTGINPGTHEDSRLYLFDSDSVGIAFNDDAPADTLDYSFLPADSLALTAPGIYYIAVSMYETVALDASGNQIFEDPRDFGPAWKRINRAVTDAPLGAWFLRGDGGKPFGTYRITFTGTTMPTGVETEAPAGFVVSQAYPNPFGGAARIDVGVDVTQRVDVRMYDLLGREVATVYSGFVSAGNRVPVTVSAGDLASGSYFVRVEGESFSTTRSVTVLR